MSIILVTAQGPTGNSLGISEVRNIIHAMHFGPPGKTITIKHAHTLTEQAQNALLKTLEEPPNGVEIILETPDEDLLLETIRSRCQIIYTTAPPPKGGALLPSFSTISDRLDLAKEKSTKREDAETYINELLLASKNELVPKHIRAMFGAKKYLQANCNVRLVMENLFLNW